MKRQNIEYSSPISGTVDEERYRTAILELAKKARKLDEESEDSEDGNGRGNWTEPSRYPRYPASTRCPGRWKPTGWYDGLEFPMFDDEELKRVLGRKWRICVRGLYLLTRLYSPILSDEHTATITLALTSKRLNEVYGNVKGVRVVVDMARRCGLVVCVDEGWECRLSEEDNFGKLYAWNRDCAEQIVRLARENHLTSPLPRSVAMKRISKEHGRLLHSAKEKGDTSAIRISQRANLSLDWTDDEIVAALRENYPQLKWAMETAMRLNEILKDEEQISAVPSIRRTDTRISKIGFRISNPLVTLKTKVGKGSDRKWRKDYLDERFGQGGWVGYDVKSSIYRVHWLMHHGEWLDNSVDFYSKMAGFDFPDKESRDDYKYGMAMKLYFDASPSSIVAHLGRKGMGRADLEAGREAVDTAWDRMRTAIGEPMLSEIFLHEGCIYLEAFRRMVEEKGWEVVQVYDGFYIGLKPGMDASATVEEAEGIVRDCALWYLDFFNQ